MSELLEQRLGEIERRLGNVERMLAIRVAKTPLDEARDRQAAVAVTPAVERSAPAVAHVIQRPAEMMVAPARQAPPVAPAILRYQPKKLKSGKPPPANALEQVIGGKW